MEVAEWRERQKRRRRLQLAPQRNEAEQTIWLDGVVDGIGYVIVGILVLAILVGIVHRWGWAALGVMVGIYGVGMAMGAVRHGR